VDYQAAFNVGEIKMMRFRANSWVAFTIAAIVAFLFNLPLLGAVFNSLRTDEAIATGAFKWEFDQEFTHFQNAMGAAGYDFPLFFRNSILISLGAVLVVILLSVPASYAVVRLGFGGPWILRIAVALRVVPAIFFLIPFYLMFSRFGLIDSVLVLILVDSFINLTLSLLIFSNALAEIPLEIEESAAIDGASVYKRLFYIILPLLAPAMVSVAVLTFLFTWADYIFAVVLTASDATTVTVGAANFVTSYGIRWGDISAAVVLSVLPPLIFALLAQRFLVRGLAAGSIKG
jgi:multiple sugar transport system permease protein